METSKGLILKAVDHIQPEIVPINIEGVYADLQPWYDYFDIGMIVWETVQVHLPSNEPEVLKREYGDHITFFGGISTRTTLPFGTTGDVRREDCARIRVLGKNSGYICGPDHGIIPDVPMENVLAMYDEARKFIF